MRVGVLASGEGTNLQALLDTVHGGPVEIVAVASDQPGARALERAEAAGVATRVFERAAFADRPARDTAIADWLEERDVGLVVLAGYMAILAVVSAAAPPVGRTRAVEILRGGRSRALRRHAYDGLPLYGVFGDLPAGEVLARVDALLAAGRLRSTGGPYPKLRVPEARAA